MSLDYGLGTMTATTFYHYAGVCLVDGPSVPEGTVNLVLLTSIIYMVAHINSDKIVAGTSPTIKRSRLTQVSSATSQPVHTIPACSKGTGSAAQTGAPT